MRQVGDERRVAEAERGGGGGGGDPTTADRALHRRGPAGGRPVAGEEEIGHIRGCRRPHRIDPGPHREHGRRVGDDLRVAQHGGAGLRKDLPQFRDDRVEQPLAVAVQQSAGGADHDLAVAGIGRIGRPKHPLRRPADEHGMRQIDHAAVEPEVHRRDRRSGELVVGGRHEITHEPGGLPPGDGEDHGGAGEGFVVALNAGDGAGRIAVDRRDGGLRSHLDPAGLEPGDEPLTEEFAERLGRHPEVGRLRVGEKPVDGHLPRRPHRHEVDRLPEGAFDHRLPEEPHDIFRLADAPQPVGRGHLGGGSARFSCSGLARVEPGEPEHADRERRPLAQGEVPHADKQRHEMQGGRQPAGRCAGGPAAIGTDEDERAVASQSVAEARPPAEIEKVRAAAHRDMLAGIDEPAVGVGERRGAAAAPPPGLEQHDPAAGRGGRFGEGRRRREPREPAPDDDDRLHDRPRDSVASAAAGETPQASSAAAGETLQASPAAAGETPQASSAAAGETPQASSAARPGPQKSVVAAAPSITIRGGRTRRRKISGPARRTASKSDR